MTSPEHRTFVPDLHARADLLRVALRQALNPVVLGDFVDGYGDEIETITILRDSGLYVVAGNHEVNRLSMIDLADRIHTGQVENDNRAINRLRSWLFSEYGGLPALTSYGIEEASHTKPQETVRRLADKMQYYGFVDYLRNLKMWFENDDFIGIHAGLTKAPLDEQWSELEHFRTELKAGRPAKTPPQLNSHELASCSKAFSTTPKTVVSGHSSLGYGTHGRITGKGGRRVRLGSSVKHGDILYIYHTKDRSVQPIVPDWYNSTFTII